MSAREKKRETAAARRRSVELATWIVEHPPLWPMSVEDWIVPESPAKRGRGRPAKRSSKVEQMMDARGVLYRRYVKKAATAKAVAPKGAAARRKSGDPLRKRVLAEARILLDRGNSHRDLAGKIALILGEKHDEKHVRAILRTAGILPEK